MSKKEKTFDLFDYLINERKIQKFDIIKTDRGFLGLENGEYKHRWKDFADLINKATCDLAWGKKKKYVTTKKDVEWKLKTGNIYIIGKRDMILSSFVNPDRPDLLTDPIYLLCNSSNYENKSVGWMAIDTDVHKQGQTMADAHKVIECLRKIPIFKNIDPEPSSTKDGGTHTHIFFDKEGLSGEHIVTLCRRFENALSWHVTHYSKINADVEIKGTPCYTKANGEFTLGFLCKCPAYQKIGLAVSVADIARWILSVEKKMEWINDLKNEFKIKETSTITIKSGSCSFLNRDYNEEVDIIAENLDHEEITLTCGGKKRKLTNKFQATAILVIKCHNGLTSSRLMNKNWSEAYKAGYLPVAPNKHLFKIVRDNLSKSGNINWLSNEYCFDEQDASKNKACSYKLGDELLNWLNALISDKERKINHSGDTRFPIVGKHEHMTPKMTRVKPQEVFKFIERMKNMQKTDDLVICEVA